MNPLPTAATRGTLKIYGHPMNSTQSTAESSGTHWRGDKLRPHSLTEFCTGCAYRKIAAGTVSHAQRAAAHMLAHLVVEEMVFQLPSPRRGSQGSRACICGLAACCNMFADRQKHLMETQRNYMCAHVCVRVCTYFTSCMHNMLQ